MDFHKDGHYGVGGIECGIGGCEHPIPEEKIKKSGRKHPQPFCSQACATAKKKATGHFQKMSRFGLKRQMEIKEQTGKRPGYEGRSAYMRALNEKRKK